MGSRILARVIVGLVLLPMILAGAIEAADAPKRGGTLVMLVQPVPPTLASYLSTAGPIGQITAKVYDGLLEYDFSLKPLPSLAKSWQVSPDTRTVSL